MRRSLVREDFVHSGPFRGSGGMMATGFRVCPGLNSQDWIGSWSLKVYIMNSGYGNYTLSHL